MGCKITYLPTFKSKTLVYLTIFIFFIPIIISAQNDSIKTTPSKFSLKVFKDPVDGKFDMSSFLIDYNGFLPVAQLITEPALGDIGVVFTPIFIKPNKAEEEKYIPPDITMGFVGYTANKTWGFGAIRIASLPKHHLKYRVGVVHGNVNMNFYRELPVVGEQDFGFNFNISGAFAVLLRQIAQTELYLGLEYFYLYNKINPDFEQTRFPDFEDRVDFTDNISSLGVNLEYDKRDNVFTPNKGLYITSDFRVSEKWTGSDYNFENVHVGVFQYFQFTPKWVSGFRFESNLQFGEAPFFMKPAINLRGVPLAKYQGKQTYVLETEQRYDWKPRWSSVFFGGLAKAPTENISFDESKLVCNYGTGFRYLLARKFKLRAGVDVAWSNNDFGWYIVFGTAWNNRN